VVRGTGEVSDPARAQGRMRDLLTMEKELVVGIATGLGYTLSEAERTAILENGTQNLSAFLAYSRALEAEDRGDYAAATRYYQAAAQADPSFRQAREGYSASTSAQTAQSASPSDVTVLAGQEAPEPVGDFTEAVGGAMETTIQEVASTTSEQVATIAGTSTTITGSTSTGTTASQPPPPSVVPPTTVIGTIRIVFRLP